MNTYRLRAYKLLLITAIVWGVAGPIIKFTLNGISPLPFLTYRFGLSSIAVILTLPFFKKQAFPKKGVFWETILYGFLTSTVALGLLFFGLNETTVLEMAFINLSGPILITLAGVYFLHEHITKREKIGTCITLLGTLILIIQPILEDGLNLSKISGNILIFLYLLVNTMSVILAKKLVRKGVTPISMVNSSFIVGFLTILPLTLIFGSQNFLNTITNLSLPYHLGIFYMALISGNLAYVLWIKGQKTIEVSETSLFTYLHPIFAAPLAIFWLHEKVNTVFFTGLILITAGVIIAEYKRGKKTR